MSVPGSDSHRYRALVVLSGVALGAVAATPVAVLLGSVSDVSPVLATAAVVAVAVPVGVAGAARLLAPSRPESVGTGGTPVVLLGLPAVYGAVALGVATTGGSGALVVPMAVGSLLGGGGALVAVAVAGSLRAERARAESERVLEWRARAADRPSWWVRALGTAGGGAVLAIGCLLALGGAGPEVWAPVVAFGGVGTLLVVREGRKRRYAAVEAGLLRGGRLVPWSAVEDCEVTASAVVLSRTGLRADVRIDRSDLADEAAVLEELQRYVPRREPDRPARPDDEG